MVWSRYNIVFEREGIYLLYNSLSNAFVEITKDVYDIISTLTPGENCDNIDDESKDQLIRSKSIVSSDDVELQKIKYNTLFKRFSQKTLVLTINPTLACNFACPYCFEGEHPNIFMTEEVEDNIVSYIKQFKEADSLTVSWFGGEPLLNFKSLVSLSRKLMSLDLEYSAGMITNGYLLTSKIADQLPELKIRTIQVTLDGVKEEHDSRRCLKNGAPTYDIILKNITYIAENIPSIAISVRVNIDRNNPDSFLHIYNELGHKYKTVYVHPAFVQDVQGDGSCDSAMSMNEMYYYSTDLYNKTGLNFNRFYFTDGRRECAVRKSNAFVIGPEGELYKCWNDVGKQERIYGNITNGGTITNESVLYNYLIGADQFNDSECLNCVLLPTCAGGCPYTRLLDMKRSKKMACPIDRAQIKDYLWAHYCTKAGKKINLTKS